MVREKTPAMSLPKLRWLPSPNHSARRLPARRRPWLVVVHRPVGTYGSAIAWLRNPASSASAHVVTASTAEGGGATQLVPWNLKAWACCQLNSASYNVEVADAAWTEGDEHALRVAARIVAFVCHKTGIPPAWSRDPLNTGGIVRHYDLGLAGCGHTDPTEDLALWRTFLAWVKHEATVGGFRDTWGKGGPIGD